MPEKVLKKLNTYILPQWKVCFISALVVGLIAHLYKITNWLPNWDSLVFRVDSQNMIGLGRWFLPVVCSLSSFYDLPFLNGILAIIFHGLGAVFVIRMFDIKKNITAFLTGAVIVSFPAVTSVMMYNYVADGYGFAFFLSALSAYLMTREKPKYIISMILIALSTGIYQAYITVTIMLILLKLIDDIVFHKKNFDAVLKKGVCIFLTGLLGMALYSMVLKMVLGIFSAELLDYQGINDAASLGEIDLLASLYIVKETFVKCFFDMSGGINVYVPLNIFVASVTAFFYLIYIIRNKVYKNVANIFALVILGIMLIMGAGALAFINSGIDYHSLMRMGYFVFYMFFLLLYERGTEGKHTPVKCWIVFLIAFAIIINQVVIANVSYHKAQIAYEKSYGVLMRIADRIEETEEAENCHRILVLGALKNSENYSVNLTPEITGITDGYIIRKDDETVGQSVLASALADYCEKDYEFLKGEEKKAFSLREDVRAMGIWPNKDSVSVIDNILVIKLSAEGESK